MITRLKKIEIIKLLINNFKNKKIDILSNHLTYVTAFAIFPFLAIVIGISKGFGLDKIVVDKLIEIFPKNETVLSSVLDIIQKLILSIQTGLLAGLGIVMILYSVIKLLMTLENSFNDIWRIKKNRDLKFRILNYIAIVFLFPILILLIIGSSSIFIETLETILGNLRLESIYFIIVRLINISFIGFLITILFYIIPNTNVKFKYSFYSAVIITILIYLLTAGYVYIQQNLNSYNAVYGSLAFVPIFLIWLKLIWTLVLLGSELNYILQMNKEILDRRIVIPNIHFEILSLYIFLIISNNFKKSMGALSVAEISKKLNIKNTIVSDILNNLEYKGFIYEIIIEENSYYQVKVNPDTYTLSDFEYELDSSNFNIEDIFIDNIINENYIRFYEKIHHKDTRRIIDLYE